MATKFKNFFAPLPKTASATPENLPSTDIYAAATLYQAGHCGGS